MILSEIIIKYQSFFSRQYEISHSFWFSSYKLEKYMSLQFRYKTMQGKSPLRWQSHYSLYQKIGTLVNIMIPRYSWLKSNYIQVGVIFCADILIESVRNCYRVLIVFLLHQINTFLSFWFSSNKPAKNLNLQLRYTTIQWKLTLRQKSHYSLCHKRKNTCRHYHIKILIANYSNSYSNVIWIIWTLFNRCFQ